VAGRWPIAELRLADDLPGDELNAAMEKAKNQGVTAEVVPRDALERLCHTSEHQGYLARMGPFPYQTVDALLAASSGRALFLVLDALQDPYNFGAILRSAEIFGVTGVVIGTARQVPVTSMVARSSAGGVNRVPIAHVEDLAQLASQLKSSGFEIVGASEKGTVTLPEFRFPKCTAIVIGNEGEGIGEPLLGECTRLVRIPQVGQLGCLNAAVAASIFCYEAGKRTT
jgi:23S rRNA (guanosine2251-2'-O)-methyltransferase